MHSRYKSFEAAEFVLQQAEADAEAAKAANEEAASLRNACKRAEEHAQAAAAGAECVPFQCLSMLCSCMPVHMCQVCVRMSMHVRACMHVCLA